MTVPWRTGGLLLALMLALGCARPGAPGPAAPATPERPPGLQVTVGGRAATPSVWWFHQAGVIAGPEPLFRFAGEPATPAAAGATVAWRLGERADVAAVALLTGWQQGLGAAAAAWEQELAPGATGQFRLPDRRGDLLLTFRFEWTGGRGGYVLRLLVP